ncbi:MULTISPECIES: DUF4783 domain-containing protein [Roseivirga]|uniref:DUF4783 domain-containing protein n=1 Tax=Roseivirga thermotolerans TaxID=1758176 RepID=A0ABQ3I430_9BACT|nr:MULTISPECIES: DUF4783 domain-containing protein [Roseivirga]GHE55929.1 hypothetical protein GCM10011340_08400 [Roseivirga thermotolerans]|tara:strand:+ start:35025 stop:35429 length:405 start_codon:yes stop_codon:yes gene_type:complete
MKTYLKHTVVILMLSLSLPLLAQEESIISKVEGALKASSSKELTKHLHEKVEIKLDGDRKEYSVNQAEIMLKQFFQQYPSKGFEFIHDGNNSSGGIIYAIGTYTSSGGSHRVVIRAKKFKDIYKVYRLEFTKER